jgi:hypothetical protein
MSRTKFRSDEVAAIVLGGLTTGFLWWLFQPNKKNAGTPVPILPPGQPINPITPPTDTGGGKVPEVVVIPEPVRTPTPGPVWIPENPYVPVLPQPAPVVVPVPAPVPGEVWIPDLGLPIHVPTPVPALPAPAPAPAPTPGSVWIPDNLNPNPYLPAPIDTGRGITVPGGMDGGGGVSVFPVPGIPGLPPAVPELGGIKLPVGGGLPAPILNPVRVPLPAPAPTPPPGTGEWSPYFGM